MSTRKATLDTVLGAVAGLLTAGGTVVAGIIVARILGVRDSGEVAYFIWLAFFLSALLDGGMSSAAVRFLPELRGREEMAAARDAAGAMLRWMLLLGLVAAAAVGLLLLYAPVFVSAPTIWALVALCGVLQTLGVFATACLRGNREFALAARLTSLSTLMQLAAVAAGAALFGVVGAIAGQVIGNLVLSVAAFGRGDLRASIPAELRSRVLRYAAFAWVGNVANVLVWSRAELFFLERSHGPEAVGLFAAALSLTGLATRLPVMLTVGVLPMLAEHKGREDQESLRAAAATGTRLLALLLFPCCLGIAALMPVLLPGLYGGAFAPAVPAAVILSMAAVASVGATVITNVIWAMERSDVFCLIAIGGAVLVVIAGVTVIPEFGLIGAAASRAVVQVLVVLPAAWFVMVRLQCPLPFGVLARILAASVMSAAVAWGLVLVKPDGLGLLLAFLAATITYILALRLFKAAAPEDVALLGRVAEILPVRFRKPAASLVHFVGGPIKRKVSCAG